MQLNTLNTQQQPSLVSDLVMNEKYLIVVQLYVCRQSIKKVVTSAMNFWKYIQCSSARFHKTIGFPSRKGLAITVEVWVPLEKVHQCSWKKDEIIWIVWTLDVCLLVIYLQPCDSILTNFYLALLPYKRIQLSITFFIALFSF